MAIMSDKRSQADYRVYREYTDQHRRRFGAWADSATNAPIGEFTPVGFQAPWLPPMRFAKFARTGDLHFRWDYASMADELGGDTAAYYKDATTFALENNKPEPELGGPVDRSIRYVLGHPPMSPAIPLAAEAGDPWILGVPGAPVNAALKAIVEQQVGASGREAIEAIRARTQAAVGTDAVPSVAIDPEAGRVPAEKSIDDPRGITYRDFMSESRKRGMSMADTALAWQAHKQALAVEAA